MGKPLTIFTESSILDIWQGSKYASEVNNRNIKLISWACSKLIKRTVKQRYWSNSVVFNVIFETYVSLWLSAYISDSGYVIICCDGVSTCLVTGYLILLRWLIGHSIGHYLNITIEKGTHGASYPSIWYYRDKNYAIRAWIIYQYSLVQHIKPWVNVVLARNVYTLELFSINFYR